MIRRVLVFTIILTSLFQPGLIKIAQAQTFDPLGGVCPADGTSPTNDNRASSTVCQEKKNKENPLTGTQGLLLRAARFISLLTGVVSVIIILYGAIKYATANGDSNTVAVARSTIIYALIGLIISIVAQSIVVFVINRIN